MVHRLPRGKTPRPPMVSVGATATATSLPLASPPGTRGQGGKGARIRRGGQWIGHPARIAETTLDLTTRQITSPIAVGQGEWSRAP